MMEVYKIMNAVGRDIMNSHSLPLQALKGVE